jgi:Na+-transporting NADH:ubiquinone oxidoreductase subunit C
VRTLEDVVDNYDQIKAAKLPTMSDAFEAKSDDLAGITRKEKWSHVYLVKGDGDSVEKYVFPIRGKGLWSILKGFIAVETDFQTIAGLTYYEHGETPGLGGEVDNTSWKEKWIGKAIYGDSGDVEIEVIKGIADADDKYAIDGLSGATITSRGVTNMLQFWLGPEGFGPYIQNQKSGSKVSATMKAENNNG